MPASTNIRTHYSPLTRTLARWTLRLCRWRSWGVKPPDKKTVFLAVPHTSNWDLPYCLLTAIDLDIPIVFTIKDDLFWWPLGPILAWMGGVPINRREKANTVDQIVDIFNRHERINLVITPEGTRKQVRYWKTGFYWIAVRAGAAIIPAFIDYKSRSSGVAEPVHPTGNFEADFEKIATFYREQMGYIAEYDPTKLPAPADRPHGKDNPAEPDHGDVPNESLLGS